MGAATSRSSPTARSSKPKSRPLVFGSSRHCSRRVRCRTDNDKSVTVAHRLGMRSERVLRSSWVYAGRRFDKEVFSLLHTEWSDVGAIKLASKRQICWPPKYAPLCRACNKAEGSSGDGVSVWLFLPQLGQIERPRVHSDRISLRVLEVLLSSGCKANRFAERV